MGRQKKTMTMFAEPVNKTTRSLVYKYRCTACGNTIGIEDQQDVVDVELTGIEPPTHALAAAAIDEIGKPSAPAEKVARRLLNVLIRKWNPKSYQFRLSSEDHWRLVRGHVYFGAARFVPNYDDHEDNDGFHCASGPDAIPHVKCYSLFGSSHGARDFLLAHLRVS